MKSRLCMRNKLFSAGMIVFSIFFIIACGSSNNAPPPATTYTVTFDSQGATTAANPTSETVTSPATTVGTLPTAPTKTGSFFGGWWTGINGTGTEFTATTAVTAAITVYAYWSNNPVYIVTYDSQGGTAVGAQHVTLPATTVGTLPAAPTKTGYIFGGWYTAINGGGTAFNASTTVAASITVYAIWQSYSYTVTFDSQGATTAANPASKTVASPATTVDALPTPPTKTGSTFAGWWTGINGMGTEFTATTAVTGNITVYAKWSANPVYTVTYDSQGGTAVGAQHVTAPATTVGTLPAAPTKTGYIFGGWYTAINGGGTAFNASTAVTADITVYAFWQSYSYTVTFDSQGATTAANPASKTVASPATTVVTLPTAPTKTGYTFAGWWTAVNGGGTQFIATTAVTANITVYANWTAAAVTYTQADITGTWNLHMLKTGSDNKWSRATATFDSNGNLTAASSCLDSTGSTTCPAAGTLTWTIDANGVISETGTNGDSEPHYSMTSNKNFIAGTGGSTGGSDAKLKIMQKVVPGTVYSSADLQSKSLVFHQMTVGADYEWRYGAGTTDATGLLTITSETSPSGPQVPSGQVGTLSVDANGFVTISGDASFSGFLSDDKKTIVGTKTHNGDYRLMIFQITGQTYTAGLLPAGTWVNHILGCGSAAPAPFWLHFTVTVASGGVMSYSNWVTSNATIGPPAGTQTGNISASGTVTVNENPSYNGQVSDDGKFVVGTQSFGTTPDTYGLGVSTM